MKLAECDVTMGSLWGVVMANVYGTYGTSDFGCEFMLPVAVLAGAYDIVNVL